MKKLFLVTVMALTLSAGISFATGTKVNCVRYVEKDGRRTGARYYGTTEIEEPSYYLKASVNVDTIMNAVTNADNGAKKMNVADRWLDDAGVFVVIAAVMQSQGNESSNLMKAVLMVKNAGYKPVGYLIDIAKGFMKMNGKGK
ncbi:MAG: hypothetical protein LBI29_00220 [Rickettsiales bacterium]|jgi:hypothetical protein|nr:hypothetical protein [Rickettsiales bacterium]